MRLWLAIPVLFRAPVLAFVVLNIGAAATALPLFVNLKFHPEIAWAFPVTLAIAAAFWYYFSGGGFPAATRESRRYVTRRRSLARPIWRAVVLPLSLSIVVVTSLRLLLPAILPMEPPKIPFNLSLYPLATVIGILAALAVSAAVVEEVAFRGYLQKPLEDSYGIVPALLVTGVAFWYAHIDKVSYSHLPFHLVVSILLGLSAYLTRSLLPAMLGHAAGDALLQPAYVFHKPDFVWAALNARPVWESAGTTTIGERLLLIGRAVAPARLFAPGPTQIFAILAWVCAVSAILLIPAFFDLARTTRAAYASGP